MHKNGDTNLVGATILLIYLTLTFFVEDHAPYFEFLARTLHSQVPFVILVSFMVVVRDVAVLVVRPLVQLA